MSHFFFFFFFRRREKVCADERRASVFCFFFGKFGNATSPMWEFLNRRAGGAQVGGSSLSRVPVVLVFFQACFLHFDLFVAARQKINYQLPQIVSFLFFIIAVFFLFWFVLVKPGMRGLTLPLGGNSPPAPTDASSCEHWNTEATCDITRNFQPIAAPDLHVTMQQCSDAEQEYWGEKNYGAKEK